MKTMKPQCTKTFLYLNDISIFFLTLLQCIEISNQQKTLAIDYFNIKNNNPIDQATNISSQEINQVTSQEN